MHQHIMTEGKRVVLCSPAALVVTKRERLLPLLDSLNVMKAAAEGALFTIDGLLPMLFIDLKVVSVVERFLHHRLVDALCPHL